MQLDNMEFVYAGCEAGSEKRQITEQELNHYHHEYLALLEK